jgi:hypothetical protein
MIKIAFHGNPLNERGTAVAIYDYAFYGREYFNFEPVIIYNSNHEYNADIAIQRFAKQFETIPYNNFNELESIIDYTAADYFYVIKFGTISDEIVSNSKNLVHSVYVSDPQHVHGHRYATVSEYQSSLSNFSIPYVPHMIYPIDENETLREQLGIPMSAIVLGRYGGWDTFDVPFIWESILHSLEQRNDLWYIFLNTPREISHSRCIFLDKIVDPKEKTKFVNTSDFMIHGGYRGETFGLAILEFAIRNKNIIVFDNFYGGRNHHLYLGDNCFRYNSKDSLNNILLNIEKKNYFNTEYLIEKYNPKTVMNKFVEVFLN